MQGSCIPEKAVISFCIPTYNRSEKVYNLVIELLKYVSDDIEVVVLDNHSTDNTKARLTTIKDSRFAFYENERNLGGIYNGLKVMTKGKGDFIVFCTDKDYINHQNIFKLISFLKRNIDIAVAFCKLNTNEDEGPQIYTKGFEALKVMAYLSKHPTGYIYKNEYLSSLNIEDNFSDTSKVMAFPFEFICAEMCLLGKAAIVNIPLCSTEPREEARRYKSHTYSGKDENAYFLPERRYDLLDNYIKHIENLNICNKYKRFLVKKVLNQELIFATIGFKQVCNDLYFCAHYNMKPRNIGAIELLKYDLSFCSKFISRCSYGTRLYKLILCIQIHYSSAIKIIKY